MNNKLEELRKKVKEKPFYQLDTNDRVKDFNETVFNYNDSNIPYKVRKELLEEMRRVTN